jgi:hypothetical protein
MTAPANITPGKDEGFVHFVARESRTVLRILVIAALAATVVSMVSLWYIAVIPAIFLLLAYAALLLVREVERRTYEPGNSGPPDPVVAEHETIHDEPGALLNPEQVKLVARESKTGLWILLGVGVIAVSLALVAIFTVDLIEPKFLGLAAFVLFAYILLVMAPVWLGWIEDDIEDQQRSKSS